VSGAPETFDVSVRALASGGAGVADLPDGRVVFVPRTLPGERARIRIRKERPRWAAGEMETLLEASPRRVEPPCPVYDQCGGCQLQHVPYEEQLEWKGRFVQDALTRIAGLEDVAAPVVVPSPRQLEYRSRVSFTLRRLRGGRVAAGYHGLGRPAHVVDVEACLLAEPAVAGAWRGLRAAWGKGARLLPPGGQLRLTLRAVGSAVELLVEGGGGAWDPGRLLDAVEGLEAVWHRPEAPRGSPAELVAGTAGAGGGVAFEQVNRDAARALRAHVLDRIERLGTAPGHAVDAYCGVGVYGRALAEAGWSVTGIERDEAAVAAARLDAPAGFTVVPGSVEARLEAALPADLVVVNPPRSGLESAATERLLGRPPAHVVYVSCDPGTLARDIRRLSARYALDDVAAFDMFPQTAHVESVVVLTRRDPAEDGQIQGATA